MADQLEKSAVLALLVRHAQAWFERKRLNEEIAAAQKRVEELTARIADCDTSFRVFGYDVSQEGVWGTLVDQYRDELKPFLAAINNIPFETTNGPPNEQASIPPPEQQPINQLVLQRLKDAGEEGTKASPIRGAIEKAETRVI